MSNSNLRTLTELNAQILDEPDPKKSATLTLQLAHRTFGPSITIASSFSHEDVTLIDLALAVSRDFTVFALDTGRLHEATYAVMDAARSHFDLNLHVFAPERQALEDLTAGGLYTFRQSPAARKACCAIRKLAPLKRALEGKTAWVTGLRREQSVTRQTLLPLELDAANGGLVKINPLFLWSQHAVLDHVKTRGLPYNALHDQGFPSIGCAPCTRAVAPGEDIRSGRWWWESPEQKECGLHSVKSHPNAAQQRAHLPHKAAQEAAPKGAA